MAIPATTDYSGRQADLESLQTITMPSGVVAVSKSIALTTPKMVSGIQKLAQRYATLLLTTVGDVKFAPKQGTQFISRIMRGNGQSAGAIKTAFAFASADAVAQMRTDDLNTAFGTIPDDERITSAVLLDFAVEYATATISFRVQLTSAAGTRFQYIIPVTVPRR